MTLRHPTPRAKRFGLYALLLLALVLVSSVVYVLATDDSALAIEDPFPDPITPDVSKRPRIFFPESVRTYDLSLNRFVDRFARVCMEARYSDFRLMLSRRSGDPLLPSRFESMFNALKEVRIVALDRLPVVPGIDGPVYIMTAQYDLEDYAAKPGRQTEQIRLAIAQEEGSWRIGPISRDALAQLDAYNAKQTTESEPHEPDTNAPSEPSSPAPQPPVVNAQPPSPALTPNQPARLEN